jgi:hypothetical protein
MYNLLQNMFYNLCDNNDYIIIYLNSEFHILEHFSHIIKKKMLHIFLITYDNNTLYHKLFENIKNEDCEDNINIYMNLKEMKIDGKQINKFFIFDLNNYDDLSKILNDINLIIENNLNIQFYLYAYLSNEKIKKRFFKNTLINNIQDISQNIGLNISNGLSNILYMHDILKIIDDSYMNIMKINILKNVNYIFIGNYIFYEITFISKKKNIVI